MNRGEKLSTRMIATLMLVVGNIAMLFIAFAIWDQKSIVLKTKPEKEIVYVQPSPTPEPEQYGFKTKVLSWSAYQDQETGMHIEYPLNWQDKKAYNGYYTGNLIDMFIWGENQVAGSELFDGASIVIEQPYDTAQTIEVGDAEASGSAQPKKTIKLMPKEEDKNDSMLIQYAKQIEGETGAYDEKNVYSEALMGDNTFVRVQTENDPQHTVYYLQNGTKIYRITTFASADKYANAINKMLASIAF